MDLNVRVESSIISFNIFRYKIILTDYTSTYTRRSCVFIITYLFKDNLTKKIIFRTALFWFYSEVSFGCQRTFVFWTLWKSRTIMDSAWYPLLFTRAKIKLLLKTTACAPWQHLHIFQSYWQPPAAFSHTDPHQLFTHLSIP